MDLKKAISQFGNEEKVDEQLVGPSIEYRFVPELLQALNILRFLVMKKEYSRRGMEVTLAIIKRIGNHYVAWSYRCEFLEKIGSEEDLLEELAINTERIKAEPKGFQCWNHRKFIFEKLGKVDLENETSFMEEILTHDSKNYHLWSYRTWLCERFGFWEHEMEFIDSMLPLDLLNNSFWSYRHFLTSHLKQPLEKEKAICEAAIEANPKNESAWNYYSSLFQNECLDEKALEFTEKIASHSNSHFPLRALFFHHLNSEQPDSKKMTQLIEDLNKTAPERSAYWTHLASRIKN